MSEDDDFDLVCAKCEERASIELTWGLGYDESAALCPHHAKEWWIAWGEFQVGQRVIIENLGEPIPGMQTGYVGSNYYN